MSEDIQVRAKLHTAYDTKIKMTGACYQDEKLTDPQLLPLHCTDPQQTRVVITGFSAIAATGNEVNTVWQAIKNGKSGIERIQLWDTSEWEYYLGGELKEYDPKEWVMDRKLLKMISRHDVIGLGAVKQVLQQSGLLAYRDQLADATEFNDRTGIYVASPGVKFYQQYELLPLFVEAKGNLKHYGEKLFEKVHPMWLLRILSNNVLAYSGIQYGFKGPNQNITNHVAGGIQAISEAAHMIQAGVMDRALVIAYDSALEPQAQKYYSGIGALSKTGLRPFNRDRDGTILAEGAGALIIESLASAQKRNAPIYAEILADGVSNEAMGVFPIRDDGDGVKRAIKLTLQNAGLAPIDIGMITAHGNGTIQSDNSEAKAINAIFPHHPPVTGFKWSLGHTLSAAGIVETVLSLLSLQENLVPGIPTLTESDVALNIRSQPQHITTPTGLIISRGFGSVNACLLIRSWK